MKINCISCWHKFDLGDAYDDYEGQVKCYICGNILEIHTHEGNVKSARVITGAGPPPGLGDKLVPNRDWV